MSGLSHTSVGLVGGKGVRPGYSAAFSPGDYLPCMQVDSSDILPSDTPLSAARWLPSAYRDSRLSPVPSYAKIVPLGKRVSRPPRVVFLEVNLGIVKCGVFSF